MSLRSVPQRQAELDRTDGSEEKDETDDTDEESRAVKVPHHAKADDHDGESTQVTDLVSPTLHGHMIVGSDTRVKEPTHSCQ